MTIRELNELLNAFQTLDILVVGDFFLDQYYIVDPDLAEVSLETELPANQVVKIHNSPGAAGTITSNLCALGVGRVRALGVIGLDGQGHDLKRGLNALGVDTSVLIETSDRFTPTYIKPINKQSGIEGERFDIKNREHLPADIEDQIIESLRCLVPMVDGIIALDQVQEHNCGVLTHRVTEELNNLAGKYPGSVCFADSRTRIGAFRNMIIKANKDEALQASTSDITANSGIEYLKDSARSFAEHNHRPVFVTLGADGIIATDGEHLAHVPGIEVPPPIDIVGAGDSVSASVVSALAAGASIQQAALVGVIASSITIQQLGTTGTATPGQILDRFREIQTDC